MTKFYIPHTHSETQAKYVYESFKRTALEYDSKPTERRIFEITYRHQNILYVAHVGKIEPHTGELVMAILEGQASCMVFTPTHGVVGNRPLIVKKEEVKTMEEFDQE